MCHFKCLESLAELGASDVAVDWVAAFLHGRQMSVKVGNALSTPRPVPGGAPQGSILGNFLFCATTNKFAEMQQPVLNITNENVDSSSDSSDDGDGNNQLDQLTSSTPTSRGQFARFRPPACLLNLSGEYQSDDESFRFFRDRPVRPYDSTDSSTGDSISYVRNVPNSTCHDPLSCLVYIDDFNCIERLKIPGAETHCTTRKTKVSILARKSEAQFSNVRELADYTKMRVNSKKTQMLCVHASKFNEVSTYIRTREDNILSTDTLKILGFNFGTSPDATKHVSGVIDKLFSRLWSLRFLKKSGRGKDELLRVYKSIIRPGAEYSSIVYHSLIPNYISERLESLQRQAIKIIFGYDVDYNTLIDNGTIETLRSRREKDILSFALKNCNSPRFGKWFPLTNAPRDARCTTRRIYAEKQCRTERTKINPIQVMIRMLNKHLQTLEPSVTTELLDNR